MGMDLHIHDMIKQKMFATRLCLILSRSFLACMKYMYHHGFFSSCMKYKNQPPRTFSSFYVTTVDGDDASIVGTNRGTLGIQHHV